MGCACCFKKLDVVAPSHKPYRVPPGASGSDFPGPALPWPSPPGLAARQAASPTHSGTHSGKLEQRPSVTSVAIIYPTELRDCSAENPAAILKRGSELHGVKVAPWEEQDTDITGNFGFNPSSSTGHCSKVFADADGLLELSERQREALHTWRRLPELIRSASGTPTPVVLASAPTSRAICQGLVGDCSFLSALSSLAEYERKFQQPVLSGIIYPRADLGDGFGPVYNEYGKYACRLFLNGTTRKVVVDDRVPVRRDGRLLCAHSACGRELWVTLLEKSFAKIMGSSYDMQGSNPGTDVFHLTGWVPETIPLNGDSTAAARPPENPSTKWDQVFTEAADGYSAGRCVICVGTSELPDAAPDSEARRLGHIEGVSTSTGLVARHAYPVLDCRQLGPHRLFRLKNPWGRVRWRGRFSPGDPAWREASHYVASSGKRDLVEVLGHDPAAEAAVDDGHFWIAWEDVVKHFSHLYLCWVPQALGLHRREAHGRWDPGPHFERSSLPDDTHLVAFNPQFLLHFEGPPPADSTTVAWVLLSRHVRVRSEIATKYVAAHIYNGGARLCCPNAPLEQGVYSNGECALVKLRGEVLQSDRDLILVVSQHAHKAAFNFTIQVYTAIPATLVQLPPLVPDSYISGAAWGEWTATTAGGCSNNLWQYFQNPQWRLEVPNGAGDLEALVLFLECPAEHSVNVRLFQGVAARPEMLRKAESSGPYRQGCCMLRVSNLAPGPYIAVVSTFRPGLSSEYRLAWHASAAIRVGPQPCPFVVPPSPPLESVSWRLPCALVAKLQMSATGLRPTLVSARLQSNCKEGPLPSIVLFCTKSGSKPPEAVKCEVLTASFAETYFAFTGAAVLLITTLTPGARYVLEMKADKDKQWEDAFVYITSDGPIALNSLETPVAS